MHLNSYDPYNELLLPSFIYGKLTHRKGEDFGNSPNPESLLLTTTFCLKKFYLIEIIVYKYTSTQRQQYKHAY